MRPWASTLNATVTVIATVSVVVCGSPAASTTTTPNTIDARPARSEPTDECDRRHAGVGSDHRDRDRQHTNDRQAQHRVGELDSADLVPKDSEDGGAEHDEGPHVEDVADLFAQQRRVGIAWRDPAVDDAGHECRDETAPAERDCDRVRRDRSHQRHDRDPGLGDQVAAAREAQQPGPCKAGDEATERTPTNRLCDQLRGVHAGLLTGVRGGDGEHDREQRNADTVVEAAFDVQRAPDTGRQVGIGNDRLPERGVGRGEHDREDRGFGPGNARYQERADRRARNDRQRQPDTEQSRWQCVLAAQCMEIDARRVTEQHDDQRRRRQDRDAPVVDRQPQPVEAEATEQQARSDEHDRSRNGRCC